MRIFPFPLVIATLAVAGLCFGQASSALAGNTDSILPPPEVQDSADGVAGMDVGNAAVDLHDELKTPSEDDNVEVRNYQRKDGAKITEYASHGHVYMVKVQPGGGMPAYYLYDENGDGQFERRLPGGYKRISPPSWVIKRF